MIDVNDLLSENLALLNDIERLKAINAELLAACHATLNVQYVNEVRDQIKAAIERAKQ